MYYYYMVLFNKTLSLNYNEVVLKLYTLNYSRSILKFSQNFDLIKQTLIYSIIKLLPAIITLIF